MSAWSRKGRNEYAEWFPEVDLVRSRWVEVKPPEPTPLVTRPAVAAEESELDETA